MSSSAVCGLQMVEWSDPGMILTAPKYRPAESLLTMGGGTEWQPFGQPWKVLPRRTEVVLGKLDAEKIVFHLGIDKVPKPAVQILEQRASPLKLFAHFVAVQIENQSEGVCVVRAIRR